MSKIESDFDYFIQQLRIFASQDFHPSLLVRLDLGNFEDDVCKIGDSLIRRTSKQPKPVDILIRDVRLIHKPEDFLLMIYRVALLLGLAGALFTHVACVPLARERLVRET